MSSTLSSDAHYALTCGIAQSIPQSQEESSNDGNYVALVYQSYAELYPNPRLTEEHLQRDALLQQVQQELLEAKENEEPSVVEEKKKKSRGLFGFLFGSSKVAPDTTASDAVIREEDYLVYTDMMEEEEDESSSALLLCGTQSVLESSCIPIEAHAAARFHLSSPTSLPIVVSSSCSNNGNSSSSIIVIQSVGVISELINGAWTVSETSDKTDLLHHLHSQQSHHYSLHHARACRIGNDCIAVSWGLVDGIVVFYRRTKSSQKWHALAMLAPTGAVLANVQHTADVFLQHDAFGSPTSPLLRVTHIVPMLVETVSEQERVEGSNNNNPNNDSMVATLVVARLGGYMEFVPLSSRLWQGGVLDANQLPKRSNNKRGNNNNKQHYAMGHLFNIATEQPENIAALTVGEHLDDLLHLEAIRTSVGVDTEWEEASSDHPPAEYLLVANGTKENEERLVFWAVATIFPSLPENNNNTQEGGLFNIHVGFLEEYSLGSVGSRSIFCNEGIWQHWRKPRRVERKQQDAETTAVSDSVGSSNNRVATLSTPAPILSLRFKQLNDDRLLLAVCDVNGGVSVLDCTSALQQACAQQPTTTTTLLSSRDAIRQQAPMVQDMAWSSTGELVVVTSQQKLVILTNLLNNKSDSNTTTTALSLPKGTHSTTLIESNSNNDAVSLLLSRGTKLITAELQLASPRSIVDRLYQSSQYAQALEAAAAFTDQDLMQGVVATCHQKLWETQGLVHHLSKVSDDLYVIQQIVGMFQDDDDNAKEEHTTVNVSSCRQACRLALSRCSTLRMASALQLDDVEDIQRKLTHWLVRAGTYSLLCQHLGAEENASVFWTKFLLAGSLQGLASDMAAKGDIKALTLLLTRGGCFKQGVLLRVLNQIPHSVDPTAFAHLLPVCQGDGDLFINKEGGIRPMSEMRQYVDQEFGYSLLLEDEDPSLLHPKDEEAEEEEADDIDIDILDQINNNEDDEEPSRARLASWFVQRAQHLQKAVGTFPMVLSFCDLGLKCLGDGANNKNDPNVDQLRAIRAFTQHMDEMLRGDNNDGLEEEELLKTDIEDLANMTISDLLTTLLGKPRTEQEAASRFKQHVLPVLSMSGIADEEKTEDGIISSSKLDEAFVLYCCDMVRSITAVIDATTTARDVRDAMAACVAVAQSSRSSMHKDSRMIKSRQSMMELVLALSELLACSKVRLLPSDARDIVKKLWQAYECLPARMTPQEEEEEPELVNLNDRVDKLFRLLIAVDIVVNWSPNEALPILMSTENTNWTDIATTICEAFCKEAGMRHKSFDTKTKLLRDVSSDLVQLRADACQLSLDLEPILHEVLLMGLLQHGEFELFVEVFSTELGGMANWDRMQPAVLNFVNEAMFGDEESSSSRFAFETDKVHTAIQCQDILGSRFPQLQSAFSGMRRHLDAAHFINTVLLSGGKSNLSPSELRDMLPMDIVEYALEENPLCVVVGCDDWADGEYGNKQIQDLVAFYFSQRDSPNSNVAMPTLPGGAVFHLANIVGLESQGCHILIQSRIVHYAKLANLPWVGAALALAMMNDNNMHDQIELNGLRLEAAANVVLDDSYDDVIVKSLLCRQSLSLPTNERCDSLDAVVKAYGELEHKVSRFCPAMWNRNQQTSSQRGGPEAASRSGQSEFLVFRAAGLLANKAKTMVQESAVASKSSSPLDRVLSPRPIDRVFQESLSGYSTDLNALYQILVEKSTNCVEDDPLLIAIARMHLFWCISNSVRVTEFDNSGTFEQSNAFDNLELGTSLMLHSSDKEAIFSNLDEMKEIAETQSASALDIIATHAAVNPVRPDLGIVRKLIELGYSENGSRRAAVMTNNESQQAAMLFAVAHAEERSFNAPLIFVKPRRDPHIDLNAMRDVKRCLYAVEQHFKGSPVVRKLKPDIVDFDEIAKGLAASMPKGQPSNGNSDPGTKPVAPTLRARPSEAPPSSPSTEQKKHSIPSPKATPQEVRPPTAAPPAIEPTSGQQASTATTAATGEKADPPPLPKQSMKLRSGKAVGQEADERPPKPPAVEARTKESAPPPVASAENEVPPVSLSRPKVRPVFEEQPIIQTPSKATRTPKKKEVEADRARKPQVEHTSRTALGTETGAPPALQRTTEIPVKAKVSVDATAPPRPPASDARSAPKPIPPRPLQKPALPSAPSPARAQIPRSPRSAPAILDRSALRKSGELARQRSRGLSNRLDHDERKRLYRKGMLLFEKARGSPTKLAASSPRSSPLKLSKAATSPRSPPPPPPARTASEPTRLRFDKAPPPAPAVAKPPPPPPPPPQPAVAQPDTDGEPLPQGRADPIEEDSVDVDDEASGDGWDFDDF